MAKLDRLSRSLVDFASLVERSSKHGFEIVVLDCDAFAANFGVIVQFAG